MSDFKFEIDTDVKIDKSKRPRFRLRFDLLTVLLAVVVVATTLSYFGYRNSNRLLRQQVESLEEKNSTPEFKQVSETPELDNKTDHIAVKLAPHGADATIWDVQIPPEQSGVNGKVAYNICINTIPLEKADPANLDSKERYHKSSRGNWLVSNNRLFEVSALTKQTRLSPGRHLLELEENQKPVKADGRETELSVYSVLDKKLLFSTTTVQGFTLYTTTTTVQGIKTPSHAVLGNNWVQAIDKTEPIVLYYRFINPQQGPPMAVVLWLQRQPDDS